MITKINNKGFTLVELLAVVAVLGLILSIATTSIISTINKSKTKSELLFVQKLSKSIDDYIDLSSSSFKTLTTTSYTFDKCLENVAITACPDISKYSATAYEVVKADGTNVTLQDLLDEKLLQQSKVVNPRNKLQCIDSTHNVIVKVYKDSDYVYYYYADLSGENTACEISSENAIINTLPTNLKEKVDNLS